MIPNVPRKKYFHSFITLFEYNFICLFFYLCIKNKYVKKAIIFSSVAFSLFLAIYTYSIKPARIDSIPIGIETILVLVTSFYYLYEQINNSEILFIYNEYSFWIVSGIMLYLAGSFFIFIYANEIPIESIGQYWMFINVFYILRNIFFIIGIVVFALQTKLTNPQPKKLYKN